MKGLMKVPIGQRRSEAVPPPNINIPEKNLEKKETQFRWAIEQPRYVLKDLILPKITEDQIADVIAFFRNRELLFHTWGLSARYQNHDGLAVNLYGPPGTGKTMAANAIASELNLPMICVNYAEIESKYVGETSKNLTALFQEASERNAVIFFDEADALLSKRVTNMTSATDVSVNQTRSVLLTLLNDYHGVILFATNFIKNYDAAFLRRIAYHIEFYLPDREVRECLWRSYIPARMPCRVDCKMLAERYDGISGSDISNAVFTAAIGAAREHAAVVEQFYFEKAIERIIAVKNANREDSWHITDRVLDHAPNIPNTEIQEEV